MATRREDFIIRNRAVDGVSKVIRRISGNFRRLSGSIDRASKRITKFKIKFQSALLGMKKSGRAIKGAGRALTTGLSLPLLALGGVITRTAFTFGKSMNRVKALTKTAIGVTNPLFEELTEKAKELGATTAFSAGEVADAMGFLAQAGFQADEILQAIAPTLDLAAAANLGLAETADIASNVMGAFGIEAKKMTKIADVLALVTARSNTDMQQLGDAMKDAAPIAREFGSSFEETAAIVGLLGNIGIQGSKAGTTLKAMFTKLAAPTTMAEKLFKKWKFSVIDSTGKMKPLAKILAELAPKIKALNKDKQLKVINELFGLRGIAGAANLLRQAINKGGNEISKFTEVLENSNGAAKDMADTMLEGFPGAVKRFQSAFEGAAIAIAESGMLEFFTDILKSMTGFLQKMAKANPSLLKFGVIIGGLLIVLGPMLIIFGSLITMVATLAPFIAGLGLGIAALSGIFLLIFGVFVAFIAWGVAIIDVWDGLPIFFSTMWEGIKQTFSDSIGFILNLLGLIPGFSGIAEVAKAAMGVGASDDKQMKDELTAARDRLIKIREQSKLKAQVDINLTGAPKGTRTSVQSQGDGTVTLNTGRTAGIQ